MAAAAADWTSLPDDILFLVMRQLGIPDLLNAGAVCSSWRPTYSSLRLPITDKSPCLLYSCDADADADDDDVATVYSPSSGATFKLRLPAPAFRRRYMVGSDHGWVATADELSNLQVWRCRDPRWVDTPVRFPLEDCDDVYDPCQELYTDEILLFKVDIDGQKLVKMDSLEDYVLFMGFNSSVCLSAKDFPNLKAGCAYLADDAYEEICVNKHTWRELGIWNFKSETLESFGDPPSVLPWLNWPPPIWITPSIY
ncbi:hypothetical protein OsI_14932 [Oryza sativa Indica Group]|uniref:F-box domain-containing protein n=1 Tax=Oryza sativa subsp. indica TaxID=39946 RepID=A2XQL6_ORYSI|nr:hypothetical protein OsI_14932 [Oryza sativa Indica Group]